MSGTGDEDQHICQIISQSLHDPTHFIWVPLGTSCLGVPTHSFVVLLGAVNERMHVNC